MNLRQLWADSLKDTSLTLPPRQFRVNRFIWYFIGVIGMMDALWLRVIGMTVDTHLWKFTLPILVALLSLSTFYRYIRKDDMLFLFGQVGGQIIAGTGVLATFSYVTARLNFPLVDKQLVAADHLFFFDWREWVFWIDHWPYAVTALLWIYNSCEIQMMIVLPLLFYYRQTAHIQRYLMAFLYSGLIIVIISTIFPAVAGYGYYALAPEQLQHVDVVYGGQHLHDFMGLRNHTLMALPFELKGIVTFPSFHAVLAVLLTYASYPLSRFKFYVIAFNSMMLIATLVSGGHYLVDILSGLLIAWHSIALVKRILPS